MNKAAPRKPSTEVIKEASMLKQKVMIDENFTRLSTANEDGRKVVSTFVPGNLNELLLLSMQGRMCIM